jgi:CheY-like chemotaxis protein
MVATCTVLYVEDNPTNLLLVERIMARRPDVQLLTAMRGDLGLELAATHCPDLILLDLHLPDMSGELVLSELKAEARTRDIPVVVVSADAMTDNIARLRGAGAAHYLTKPFDLTEFLAVIDAVPFAPRPTVVAGDVGRATASLDANLIGDLRRLAGETGELAHLVQAYEETTRAGLDQLDQAVSNRDAGSVTALAHRLKGSSATLGATRLVEMLARLETDAASLDPAEVLLLRHDIDDEFARVASALHAEFPAS